MGIVVPFGPHGAYREDKVLPGDSVVRAPAGADAVAASTLPMNGLTARMALDLMALRAGPGARGDRRGRAPSAATSSSWPRPTG